MSETQTENESYEVEVEEYTETRELTVQFVDELPYTESDVDTTVETDIHVEVSEHAYAVRRARRRRRQLSCTPRPRSTQRTSGPSTRRTKRWSRPTAGSGPPAPRPSQSRDQMLRARRRMLSILVGMTAVTGLFTFVGLLPWWILVPPAIVLSLYVLLLREIAMADAELARKRAAWEAAEAAAWARHLQAEAEREAFEAAAAETDAQIIDISGRVSDQLYDQYADAAVRAVGD